MSLVSENKWHLRAELINVGIVSAPAKRKNCGTVTSTVLLEKKKKNLLIKDSRVGRGDQVLEGERRFLACNYNNTYSVTMCFKNPGHGIIIRKLKHPTQYVIISYHTWLGAVLFCAVSVSVSGPYVWIVSMYHT